MFLILASTLTKAISTKKLLCYITSYWLSICQFFFAKAAMSDSRRWIMSSQFSIDSSLERELFSVDMLSSDSINNWSICFSYIFWSLAFNRPGVSGGYFLRILSWIYFNKNSLLLLIFLSVNLFELITIVIWASLFLIIIEEQHLMWKVICRLL